MAIVVGAALALALVVQAASGLEISRSFDFFSARRASEDLAAQAAAALTVAVLALALPPSRRALAWPVLLPAAFAAVVLALTAVAGGRAWDMAVTVLTLAFAHGLGRVVVGRLLGFHRLAGWIPVTVIVGFGLLGVGVFALGRLALLDPWLVGLPLVAGGAIVLLGGARALPGRARRALEAATSSRLRAAVAGLLFLQLGWAGVYVAAPELMHDALYAKAWLPLHWAATGEITPLIEHPHLANAGLAELVATPGHLLGAEAVGRYLQLAAVAIVVAALWRFHPLAALAFAVTPHIVWQASTAYDDALLALAALALALVALERARSRDPVRAGLMLGLVAGICVAYKYHLAPLVAGVAFAWIVLGRREAGWRLAGFVPGALAVPAWALAVRFADTGNPVFPQLNSVFGSSYWPPVNETWNFPYWRDPDALGPLSAVWQAMVEPSLMLETAPAGALGVLALALPLALLVGWRTRLRGGIALWAGLLVALVVWWLQFRYLRYLLPASVFALILITGALPRFRPSLGRLAAVPGVAVGALLAASFFPSTIASYPNVPGADVPFDAAIGRVDTRDYVRSSLPQAAALMAFNRVAEPGATVAADAHARTLLRDDLDLAPIWELYGRLIAGGGLPDTGAEALARLRELDVRWLLASGNYRALEGGGSLSELLARHGEPVFGAAGYDLYRLVDRPSRGQPVAACDPMFAGADSCWAATLDESPGLTASESPNGASIPLDTCPGQTLAVDARTAPDGEPALVVISFDDPDPTLGFEIASVPPGALVRVLGTAPPGAEHVIVTLRPGAGGEVESAEIHAFGACA